jgi:hypothetical protein
MAPALRMTRSIKVVVASVHAVGKVTAKHSSLCRYLLIALVPPLIAGRHCRFFEVERQERETHVPGCVLVRCSSREKDMRYGGYGF